MIVRAVLPRARPSAYVPAQTTIVSPGFVASIAGWILSWCAFPQDLSFSPFTWGAT